MLKSVSKTRELQPTPKNTLPSYRFNGEVIIAIIWIHSIHCMQMLTTKSNKYRMTTRIGMTESPE
jgi:hypothetical protein